MKPSYFLLFVLILLLGCERREPPQEETQSPALVNKAAQATAPVQTAKLFHAPVEPRTYELPAEALITWRQYKAQKPVLVILADQPYLSPLPQPLQAEALELLQNGTDAELGRRADYDQPDPLIISPQAVRAALLAQLFSEVVWLLPDDRPIGEFSWAIMNEQLRVNGLLAADQELALDDEPGIARLQVETRTLTLAHPDAWSKLQLAAPVLLHLDLSYFKSTYRSEARIPVYELITTLAGMLRAMELEVVATTLSYSTLDGYVDLDGRFTLPALATLMREPQRLAEPLAPAWKLRAQALNHLTMFNETEATRLYHELLDLTPDDPAALYDVATRRFYAKQFAAGLELIDRAVALDPGYVVRYLTLSEQALKAGDLHNAIELLQKYQRLAPDTPGIKLRLAELFKQQGRVMEAQSLLAELAKLPWSPVYHPQLPALIEGMRNQP